jgi:hypothetical protein
MRNWNHAVLSSRPIDTTGIDSHRFPITTAPKSPARRFGCARMSKREVVMSRHKASFALACAGLVVHMQPCFSDTSTSTTASAAIPSRGDDLSSGDKIKLKVDAPIFKYDTRLAAPTTKTKGACAPAGTILEIVEAPIAKTTTAVTPAAAAPAAGQPGSTVTVKGTQTTVNTKATAAGDTTTTTTDTVATAAIIRVGGFGKNNVGTCRSQIGDQLDEYSTVVKGTTYEFTPADLAAYDSHRFGWTYGGLVVPNKIIISDRSFTTSSSIFPYVGYENWAAGVSGTVVFAAGIGTAPASAQTTTTPGTSTATKATFSVAVGEIWQFGSIFKVGVLLGTDTAGSKTGYKYQGKPWIGITLGAGK